ncbi:ABC transporter permease [Arthrobacter sp. P2b]|uniref:ABC transporter permease n=1 Tax=Arthrobacter sp. P2b TaxID=1938741 RepID=UPI0009A851A5|nr:ABC transporter permease [Arthrobacter sp. P2b]
MGAQALVHRRGAGVMAGRRPATAQRQQWAKRSLGLVGVLGFLLMWQCVSLTGVINPQFLPPASAAITALVVSLGTLEFWEAVRETMLAWGIGLGIAAVTGIVAGFVIGSSSFIRKATHSTIEFLRPIPSVGLIPIAVILFGVKIESSLMLIIYAAFWQILIQVLYGVADVDMVADNTARSFGLGPVSRLRYVTFPSALPFIFTGVRLAAAIALILAITAELIIGSPGLGHAIALAQSGGAVAEMYGLVLAAGLIGVMVNLTMRLLEKKTLSWHSSIRSEIVI